MARERNDGLGVTNGVVISHDRGYSDLRIKLALYFI